MHVTLAGDDQCCRGQRADEDAAVGAETLDVLHASQRRVVADVVGRGAVRLLPDHLTGVHVVGGDAIPRRLDQWNRTLQRGTNRATAATGRATRCCTRGRAGRWSRLCDRCESLPGGAWIEGPEIS